MIIQTKTFTPVAGGEDQLNGAIQSTWAASRAQSPASGLGGRNGIQTWSFGSFVNDRSFMPFDTRVLGGATILSATISLYRDDSIDTFANVDTTTIEIIKTTEADPTTLSVNDMQNVTLVSIGSVALSATASGSYSVITISDLTAINPGGYSKLGAVTGRDLSNTAPTGRNEVMWQDHNGANPPTLTLTYQLPQGFVINKLRPRVFAPGLAR